jgi:uncharacterized membrane protein
MKFLGFGFQLKFLTRILFVISILATILTYILRIKRYQTDQVEEPEISPQGRSPLVKLIITIFVVVLISYGGVYSFNYMNPVNSYTDMILLGANGTSVLPNNLTVGQQGNVTVKVVNHEDERLNYRMVVKYDNTTLNTYNFTLGNKETWQQSITFRSAFAGNNRDLKFLLYKNNDTDAYLSKDIFIYVS